MTNMSDKVTHYKIIFTFFFFIAYYINSIVNVDHIGDR